MGISVFPQPSAGGNSNLTTSDLTTYSASIGRMTKQTTYNNTQSGLTYPSGVSWVYALVVGGGGGGQGVGAGSQANYYGPGGQGGAASFGVTRVSPKVVVGAGGNAGSSGGNTEFEKSGGTGGNSIYGSIYAYGGGGGYSYYNGTMQGTHQLGFSSLVTGRIVAPGQVSINAQPSYFNGASSVYNYSDASMADYYSFTANGATGERPGGSVTNNANYAAGLPTNIGGYNGGARGGGINQGGNVVSPFRGGGGAGYLGNGGAASANAGGNGGSGGGGGGGAGPAQNWDVVNNNWQNSAYANGGAGGAGVVELYY